MRIYACYTDSHLPLLEQHFLPSLPAGFDLVLRHLPQSCPAATYNSPGWGSTMQDKVRLILDAIDAEDYPFVVSDVDVRFYSLVPEHVAVFSGQGDVVYQLDQPLAADPERRPKYCAGFCVVRPCGSTRELYRRVLSRIPEHNTEQEAIYAMLTELAGRGPRVSHLPPDMFWCLKHGAITAALAVDHASWVLGVPAKLAHLEETRAVYEKLLRGGPDVEES